MNPKEEKPDLIIDEKIKNLQTELQSAVNERNYCIRQAEQLLSKINYLSGKIDALKEL